MNNFAVRAAKENGFTLLEILIAGFILFLVLTTMTQVYSGALSASEKAKASPMISGAVPSIRTSITEIMRETPVHELHGGDGQFGSLQYTWLATIAHKGEPSTAMQEDSSRKIHYLLWDINLRVTNKTLTKSYSFRELTW